MVIPLTRMPFLGMTKMCIRDSAYECASMIAYCLRNGATTRQELYDALLAIDYWPGKTGANR